MFRSSLFTVVALCVTSAQAQVTVTYSGDTFPAYIVYDDRPALKTDEELAKDLPFFETHDVDDAKKNFTIKPGKVKLWVRPMHNNSCSLPVQYSINNGEWTEITIFAQLLEVADKDSIRIKFHPPIAPWNASIVMVKGKPVLVGLDRPWSTFELTKWEEKNAETDMDEEFSNSLMMIAKYGVPEMAARLAKYCTETKKHRKDHVSAILSLGLVCTEDELKAAIEKGLTNVLKKALAKDRKIGLFTGEDLMIAQEFQRMGRGQKKKK